MAQRDGSAAQAPLYVMWVAGNGYRVHSEVNLLHFVFDFRAHLHDHGSLERSSIDRTSEALLTAHFNLAFKGDDCRATQSQCDGIRVLGLKD